mgnify:CR=1 FL=1
MFHFCLRSIFILRKSILWLFRTTHPLRKDILITWSKGKLTYSGPYVIQRWPPTKHVTYLKVMRYLDGTKQSQHSEKLPIVILYTWQYFEDADFMSENVQLLSTIGQWIRIIFLLFIPSTYRISVNSFRDNYREFSPYANFITANFITAVFQNYY